VKGKTGGVTVEVQGAKELRRTMKAAGADMTDFGEANATAGRIVAAEAPVWIHAHTGSLGASVRAGTAKTSATVRAGGAKVPYAGVVEWGWPAKHIAPHPFLTTAAKSTEATWVDAYLARLEAIVAKIHGK
jgi:hypothetical protein